MTQLRQRYVDPEELADELERSQSSGEPTVRLCELIRLIAQRFYRRSNYQRYTQCDKDEMASYALECIIRRLHNYRPEYRKSCFSYVTRSIHNASLDWLDRFYYRPLNVRRAMTRDYAHAIMQIDPATSKRLLERMLDEDNMHVLSDAEKGKRPPLPSEAAARGDPPDARSDRELLGK